MTKYIVEEGFDITPYTSSVPYHIEKGTILSYEIYTSPELLGMKNSVKITLYGSRMDMTLDCPHIDFEEYLSELEDTSDKDDTVIIDYLKQLAKTHDKLDAEVLKWIDSEITRLEIASGIFDISKATDEDIISVALLELSNKYRAEHKDDSANKVAQVRTRYLDKCNESKRLGKYIDTNLNYHIKIRLNELGKKLYNDFWKNIFPEKDDFYNELKKDKDGYCSFQMWQFMEVFGSHIHLGCEPFADFNVLIEKKDK